ncbi:ribosome-binding factor A [Patescibacteria group bacterium]|nr:ribosome-binding factor A [Patescibacteria group bacterium]MBU4082897.1 ribosome-binding factor A [Patescibacteria group bacterium]MCG2809269.1 ribosome-binding factor A [Candidatus Portnoybacteria bacterium]
MSALRIEKVNELLRQEVSKLLLKEVDFEGAFVTITNVDTAPNLQQSKIMISVLPNEKIEKVLDIMSRNIFHLQKSLNKKLYMRPVPKMIFEIDKVEEHAQRIEEILGKIKR